MAALSRTLQILNAQHPLPEGVRQNEAAIEKTSLQKAEADSAKGKSMDELSDIVKQITAQLREQKNRLAPQIKELRYKNSIALLCPINIYIMMSMSFIYLRSSLQFVVDVVVALLSEAQLEPYNRG